MSLKYFSSDLQAASTSKSFLKKLKWLLFNHTLHLLLLFRIGQDMNRIPFVGRIFSFTIEYIIRIIYSSDISCRACIGPGLVIMHGHDIVIGGDVRIGLNCKIFNGVTLGNKDVSQSSAGNQPTVGNNVIISTGAKILGPVKIGNSVTIGANSVVIKDCVDGSIVAGVPAKVIGTNFSAK